MIYEGQALGPKSLVFGLAFGALFIRRSKMFLDGYEDVRVTGLPAQTPSGVLLFLAIMALHSFGEGAGVGLSLIHI